MDIADRFRKEKELAADIMAYFLLLRNKPTSYRLPATFLPQMQAVIAPHLEATAFQQYSDMAHDVGFLEGMGNLKIRQRDWSKKYTSKLVTSIWRNIKKDIVYSKKQGGSRADALAFALNQNRANNIGITETTRAGTRGAILLDNDVIRTKRYSTRLVWHTTELEDVCPVCKPLNGTFRSVWSKKFPLGTPAHVRCRCWLVLEIVEL